MIKKYSKKKVMQLFSAYQYVIILMISSALVLGKSYAYSFILDINEYSQINYFLLVFGFFTLIAPLGLNLKCHYELPRLVNDENKFSYEVDSAKSIITFVFFIALILFFFQQSSIVLLGLTQGYLYSLFMIDTIALKSKGKFNGYGLKIAVRNLSIFCFGVFAAITFSSAKIVMIFEVIAVFLFSLISRELNFQIVWNSFKKVYVNKGYLTITVVSAIFLYIDRQLASVFLDAESFSVFSYFYIVILVSFSLQQFINTKFITQLSQVKALSVALQAAVKRSIIMILVSIIIASCSLIFLFFNKEYRDYFDFLVILSILLLAATKAADFFQSLYVSYNLKKQLIKNQLFFICLSWGVIGLVYYLNYLDYNVLFVLLASNSVIYFVFQYIQLRKLSHADSF